jgi:hypothetical protein
MEKKKIVIATPIHTDHLIMQYVTSVFKLINDKESPFEVNVMWKRTSLVNRGRNELVGLFLESNYDYIFFIDSDIVDFVDAFYTIATKYIEAEKHNPLLMLGAIYPIKHFNFDYIKNESQLKEQNWNQILLNYNVNINQLGIDNDLVIEEADKQQGLVQASSIAGGFMMLSRYAINKMIEHYPESAYKNFANEHLIAKKNYNLFHSFVAPDTKFYLSEDYGFCYNFLQIKGLMLADIKVKLSHYGEQTFTGSLYETLQLKKKQSSNIEISH